MNDELLGKHLCWDIETFVACTLFSFYNPITKEWKEFEISAYRNDLYSFVKWYSEEKIDYLVGFNTLNFDAQVVEYVLRHYNDWYDLPGDVIAGIIAVYAGNVIYLSNNKQYLDYREWDFHHKHIDLFKVWHYDRDQRSTGLKKLEFSMCMDVEELPIDHKKPTLTQEEILDVRAYCRHDILATANFLEYTLGNTEHSLYKGDNKLEMRMTLKDEFKLPTLNLSDSRIGDEIIRKEYCKAAGISEKDLPIKGFFRKDIPIKWCIPSYVKFSTPQLQEFLKDIRKKKLKPGDDFSETIYFYDQKYDFKKGGLHNVINGRKYVSDDDHIILDLDVTGYYPRSMINNKYAPYHLKKEAFIKALLTIVEKREDLKPQSKKDKKIKGIVAGLKLSANAVFGKTSDVNSWMMDKMVTMQTTITGELSLLMLIESLENSGIKVIMANTDGIMLYTKRDNIQKIEDIKQQWMAITGLNLEQSEFEFIAFSTVNDYIGRKTDGDIKVKGDFLQDTELHGDRSRRIVRIALHKYFTEGISVEDTINNHDNIHDFCIGVKSSDKFHYELIEKETGESTILKKMVCYYISRDGRVLLKVNNENGDRHHSESEDRVNGQYQPLVTYFNRYFKREMKDYMIDYHYYIHHAKSIIYKIESGGKSNRKLKTNPQQISMF